MIDQELPDLLVESVGRGLLGRVLAHTGRLLPLFLRLLLRFVPARIEGQVGVFYYLAKTNTPELGCEGCLSVRGVGHRKAEDVLGGLAERPVELDGLIAPLMKRSRPHEVDRTHDGEGDPQKVEGRLGIFELDELTDGGLQPTKQLLAYKIAHESTRPKRNANIWISA